jgi:uncharacterized protein involved in exopolysaccharide biosynthesis
MQLQQVTQQLATEQNNKQNIEKYIADAESQTDPTPVNTSVPESSLPAAQQLKNAENALALLLISKRPENPDVQALQRTVNGLRRQVTAEEGRREVGQGAGADSPFEVAKRKRLAELRDALEQAKVSVAGRQADEKSLKAKVDLYQARVNAVPIRSAELISLMRDYAAVNKTYNDLFAAREAAKMTMNLESKQLGEQFNVIDPARLPQRPSSPNRVTINLMGIIGGLALGLLLVAFMEYRDTTFKTDYELTRVLSLPVLAVVPLMVSPAERRAEFRRKLMLNLGFGSAVAVCFGILAYSFLFPH